jgi:hypothetical protein
VEEGEAERVEVEPAGRSATGPGHDEPAGGSALGIVVPPNLDRGIFTLSFDFELAWGSRDIAPEMGALTAAALVTRDRVLAPLLQLLAERDMVATWATVGSLFLDGARRVKGVLHPDLTPPQHTWRPDWLAGVPEGTEAEQPAWYGRSLVIRLRDAGQEIGSHSFTHPIFGDPGCSRATADSELGRCVDEARALGISLRSFVFPRNIPGHVDLLARHGFTCWRPPEVTRHHLGGAAGRLAHLVDVARSACPETVLPTVGAHGLVEIPASATVLPVNGVRRFIPIRQRRDRCIRGLDRAAAERRVFHLYSHPINLADDPAGLLGLFADVLDHAAALRRAGRLDVLPMAELAARVVGPGSPTRVTSRAGAASSAPSLAG